MIISNSIVIMGVKCLLKAIQALQEQYPGAEMLTYSGARKVADMSLAVDANLVFCEIIAATVHKKIDPESAVLVQTMNLVTSLRAGGARKVAFVFDHPRAKVVLKQETIQRRQEDRKKRNAPKLITRELTSSIIQLCNLMGVEVHFAPQDQEAEQYCAYLCKMGVVSAVITNDTDAIMFGAPLVISRNRAKKAPKCQKFVAWHLDEILSAVGQAYEIKSSDRQLEMRALVEACVGLGTDFADKIGGIGPKTVFRASARDKIERGMDERRVAAVEFALSGPRGDPLVHRSTWHPKELAKYLEIKGFQEKRISAYVEKLRPME